MEAEIKAVEDRRRQVRVEMEKLEVKAKEIDDLALRQAACQVLHVRALQADFL